MKTLPTPGLPPPCSPRPNTHQPARVPRRPSASLGSAAFRSSFARPLPPSRRRRGPQRNVPYTSAPQGPHPKRCAGTAAQPSPPTAQSPNLAAPPPSGRPARPSRRRAVAPSRARRSGRVRVRTCAFFFFSRQKSVVMARDLLHVISSVVPAPLRPASALLPCVIHHVDDRHVHRRHVTCARQWTLHIIRQSVSKALFETLTSCNT